MPKVGFVCPDGKCVETAVCLAGCRMGQRCLTKSSLTSMSWDRPWKGKPSTTQLLKPTRIAYLELTQPYYVDPQDMAWMFIGSKAHAKLEMSPTDVSRLEECFSDEEMTGIADCYEQEGGRGVLTDYKVVGAFSACKLLGLVSRGKQPTGQRYYKSGPWGKAGDPIMKEVWECDPAQADYGDYQLQLNRYRLWYEQAGFPVHRMQLQVIVRDGGLQTTKDKGIDRNMYLVEVPRVDDPQVKAYFSEKRGALLSAMDGGGAPARCSPLERWKDRRCRGYCNVREHCEWGRSLK